MIRLYQDSYIFEKLEESVNFKVYSNSDYEVVKISGNMEVDITIDKEYFTLTSKSYGYGVYEVIENNYDDNHFNYIAIVDGTIDDSVIPNPGDPINVTKENGYTYYPYLSYNNNTYLIRVNNKWYNLNLNKLDSSKYKIITSSTSIPNIARLNLRVERDIVNNQIDKNVYLLKDDIEAYTLTLPDIPAGYSFNKLEYMDEVSDSGVYISDTGNWLFNKINTIGVYKYEIVVTKDNKEYKSGVYTIIVVESIINEDTIEVIKGEEYKLTNVRITSGDNICYPLTITNSENNADCKLEEINGSNIYSLSLIGTNIKQSILTLYCYDIEIGTITLNVVDSIQIPNLPNKIELQSAESITFRDIFYYNNFKYNLLNIYTDLDSLFTLKVRPTTITESSNNATYNVGRYVIELIAKSGVSGISNLYIKSEDNRIDMVIPVLVTRTATGGNIETSDNTTTGDNISLYENEVYTISYVYDENADNIDVTTSNDTIVGVVLEEIPNNPYTYSLYDGSTGQSTTKTKFFSNNSIYKMLTITGKRIGTATIVINTYVNGTTLSNTLTFIVNILEQGSSKNDSGLVNIYPSNKTYVNNNIMLELPEQSCTLRLREEKEIQNAMVNANGSFFDYIENSNPTKTSNPVSYINDVNPTWLNKTTMEIFTCIDTTTNNNIWIGTLGTRINYDKLPLPGEQGFGCGIATDDILEKYKLSPMDGTTNPLSSKFGHYIDADNKEFVFVPLHYIKPKYTTNKEYPYFNQNFDFSYEEDINNGFNNHCIPRCFWNNGIVQNGIFVAVEDDNYVIKEINNNSTDIEFISYPNYVKDGYHNMNIFIQTMLYNLSRLHLIKTYENSNSVTDGRLYFKSETLTREVGKSNTTSEIDIIEDPLSTIHIRNDVIDTKIDYNGNTSNIGHKLLLTHNGQKCGIPNINGGFNSLLIGIYIHSETDGNGVTTLHTHVLDKDVEISEFDRNVAVVVNKRNNTTYKDELITTLFSNSNYSLVSSIPLNTIPDTIYVSNNRPNYLNPVTNDHTLGEDIGYYGFNIGIDLSYISYVISNNKSLENYTTTPNNNGIISLGDTKKYDDKTSSYRICVSNIIPTTIEVDRFNINLNNNEYGNLVNHPNTRVARPIFDMRNIYPTGKPYTIRFSSRCCITPNMK